MMGNFRTPFILFCLLFAFLIFSFHSGRTDDLDDIVLYGQDSITLRSNSSVTGGTVFSGGTLTLGLRSEITGNVYVEETLTMSDQSLITGDAFVGIEAILNGSATITGTLLEGVADFPEVTIPIYENVPGTNNVSVLASRTRVLVSGAYNNITVFDGGILTLQGGEYQINRLIVSANAILVVNAPATIISVFPFAWDGADVQFSGEATAAYDLILYTSSDRPSVLQADSYFKGVLYSPNGIIRMESFVTVIGTFKALAISISPSANVEWSAEKPPCTPIAEICDDGIDQDCDDADLNCNDADLDGDGYSVNEGDTDDNNASVNPSAQEVCDGIDNDSDGLTDDADESVDPSTQSLYYADTDNDTYGDPTNNDLRCTISAGYVTDNTDCDDAHAESYPGATEVCDALDNDCDGTADGDDEIDNCDNGVVLPPDPSETASEVDATEATTVAESTEFLYSGDNPTQTGVEESTIDITHAAVIRGQVFYSDSTALPGVTISVHDHPEFGTTLTRDDGMFDLVLNGGGTYTLDYEKEDYLPVQRQVAARWQEYVWTEDVILTPLDGTATAVDFDSPLEMQVVLGGEMSDNDGTRQSVLLIPAGTTAQMELSDGTVQTLTSATVRITEFTVDEDGDKAMPGTLPATSAYTYAADFTIDEALDAGATDVTFSQPVISYLNNFLSFPAGTIIPLGYYDQDAGAWVGSDNGLVLTILSITDGLADLDIDGSGTAADATALADIGISDEERENLASLYTAGASLWRVTLSHFSSWDSNWPYGYPTGAVAPSLGDLASLRSNTALDDPTCGTGSIIECENQILGEMVPLVGVPFTLHYRSDRTSGYSAANTLQIPISGDSLPSSLTRIDLTVSVAGTLTQASYEATANQTITYTWDGKDGYGRALQGNQDATVRVDYVYDAVYVSPSNDFEVNFGNFGDLTAVLTDRTRNEIALSQTETTTIGAYTTKEEGIGGWTFNIHHTYDSQGKILHLGDGRRRHVEEADDIITTIAGDGTCVYGSSVGDGGDALDAVLCKPSGIAVDTEGNIYVASDYNQRVRKIDTDGIITTVAGTGVIGSSGDNGPATSATLWSPRGLAVDTAGNLYMADSLNGRVRKVDSDGIITTVAGGGSSTSEGIEATSADLGIVTDVALDTQGNLYLADPYNRRIRKVDRNGIIVTIAGDGSQPNSGRDGDGGPATEASFCGFYGSQFYMAIDVDQSGNIYIADPYCNKVRKITPDGLIDTVVGNNSEGAVAVGDGGLATDTSIGGTDVVIDHDGNILISTGSRIRKVTPDGIITTIAGDGSTSYTGDNGPAAAASVPYTYNLALDSLDHIYITSYSYNRIRKILPPFSGFSANDILISSEDASQIYQFDEDGKHLSTLNAQTSETLYEFGYNDSGYLTSITDGDGKITTIERDTDGIAAAIVGPYGQKTTLAMDENNYLKTVTNLENESYQMTYDESGLLQTFAKPRGYATTFTYDSNGFLTRDEDVRGGYKSLSRSGDNNNYTVTLSTALSRTHTYHVEKLSTGDTYREVTTPDNLTTATTVGTNGTTEISKPDGTAISFTEGPDPRFGMMAPLPSLTSITTPAGLNYSAEVEKSATLTDDNDWLSLETETTQTTINDRTYTATLDASTKEITMSTPTGRQGFITLDGQGRVVNEMTAGLEEVAYVYDPYGRLDSITAGTADPRTYNFDYNTEGFLETITDPESRTTIFDYDLAGRVTTQTLPDSRQITYTYDDNGNLESITPPSKPAHTFTYNEVDLASGYLPPALSPPLAGGVGGGVIQYDYNLDKQLDLVTRPDGQTIDLEYDTAGRLYTVTTSRGATTYNYNTTTGNLETITAPSSETLTYAYDGFLPTTITWSGTINGSVIKGYDDNFWMTSLSLRGAGGDTAIQINFDYDDDGLLITAGDLTLIPDPNHGLVTATTLSNIASSTSYNGIGEIETDTYTDSATGNTLYSMNITDRDDLGRIEQRTINLNGTNVTYDYTYDTAGRLYTASISGLTSNTYTYDDNGNRDGGSYDDQDRLTSYGTNTYTYTDNGELETKYDSNTGVTLTYDYDALGNLITVTSSDSSLNIEYVIDGQNRRIGKKESGMLTQAWLYADQLRIVAELDGSGNITKRFIYAEKSNVPSYMITYSSGTATGTYRIISDHLGSVMMVVDVSDGSIDQQIIYDEFGKILNDSSPGFQPFGFAGGLYDEDTGLTRFGARDYDPETARWTAKDPILFNGGDTNLYGYVINDPVNLIDPLGLEVEVGVRNFYPIPVPYARHCFLRFNGSNNDTLSFDSTGVHADPNPRGGSYSPTKGSENDSCVKNEMKKCKSENYDFNDFNCCHCASNALNACGLSNEGAWPNWPYDASNPPYSPVQNKGQ